MTTFIGTEFLIGFGLIRKLRQGDDQISYDFSPQLLLIMHQFLLDVGELGIELIVLGLLCGGQVAVLCHEKHLTAKVVRCHMPPGEVLSENVIIPK